MLTAQLYKHPINIINFYEKISFITYLKSLIIKNRFYALNTISYILICLVGMFFILYTKMKYENSRYKWLYGIIPYIVYFLMNLKFSENSMFDGISSIDQDFEDIALDLAIKLKKEYSDDPVSDLFAASYDLQKIARISDLDDSLFHFKLYKKSIHSQKSINKSQFNLMIHEKKDKIRFKRFIHDKIQNIRNDDRVEYVHTQTYLIKLKYLLYYDVMI
ncbi:hypothetical protein BpHYR1_041378 [Brachionus plicatilis]|uniref:Uncharacterized protein n=1 Tax=Brachionus plicatilis TaxID=10195 RepID=A0A3M7SKZ1_BRAPC|nr:hypothetical protein BpHYR1_041378 [Brachionus plicatilis]